MDDICVVVDFVVCHALIGFFWSPGYDVAMRQIASTISLFGVVYSFEQQLLVVVVAV